MITEIMAEIDKEKAKPSSMKYDETFLVSVCNILILLGHSQIYCKFSYILQIKY